MRGTFLVGGFAALASDLALFLRVHR
jgi:hypothetical protein